MLSVEKKAKAVTLSLLMFALAQTTYIGAMQGWSYPTELDEPSPQHPSAALENLFPDLDLRLFVDPSNSSSYSGSGTNLIDLSTYDHNGTIDGATWDADRTRFTYDGTCTGTSPDFVCDEVNFTETNDHDPAAGGDWSVSTWFNASTIQQSVIVGKVDDGGASVDVGWMIRMNSNGVRVDVGTTGNSSSAWTSHEAIATDRWYHVVLVASKGTSLAMFIDGVEADNISLASSGDLRNTANGVSIGSYNAGEYNQPFDGQIGAVMAYADALNLTAVNQLYNASKGVYSNTTSLSYAPQNMTLEKGTTMTTNTPSVSGGAVTSWEIDPSLPSGLSFGSTNGSIWGT
ncbi:MAG: LamG domain-containing protein, partial [Candidatus Poseidoniales archaeon]